MAFEFGPHGYPIWKEGMTTEEKRAYRRLKHRAHAARSRRLRGTEVPESGKRGERQPYAGPPAACAHCTFDHYGCLTHPIVP